MSELKYYKLFHRASALTSPNFVSVADFGVNAEIYDKAEADNYIALLKDKANYNEYAYKLKSEELADTCRFYEDELRHQKYKRCLDKAKWCLDRVYLYTAYHPCVISNKFTEFYEKWYRRWLKLAEQFKEVK